MGSDDIGGPVQQSSRQPAAVGAQQYRLMYGLGLCWTRVLELIPSPRLTVKSESY